MQARRLQTKLQEYYAGECASDPIWLAISGRDFAGRCVAPGCRTRDYVERASAGEIRYECFGALVCQILLVGATGQVP